MSEEPDYLTNGDFRIDRSHRLGGGSFGVVYMGENTATGKPICAKHLHNSSVELSQKEIGNLERASNHRNIVKFYNSFVRSGAWWIVMEYCKGATLDDHVKLENPDFLKRLDILCQLSDALKHLHNLSPPMAHRDIKPENVIVCVGHLVKVCDFGLAKSFENTATVNAHTFGGTRRYMAPELFGEVLKYDAFKADIFSMGLVFLGVVTCMREDAGRKRFEAFFEPEQGSFIGSQMYAKKQQQEPANVLSDKISELSHPNRHVMQLMETISRMVQFDTDLRSNAIETMVDIAEVREKCEHLTSGSSDGV